MTFDQIAWLPLCAGLTAVGIGLSYLAFRRRSVSAGLRAIAWSLLPLAAYLTGALRTLWAVGSAAVGFVTGLVFSPAVWAGVALTGLSVLLFVVSGALRGRAGSATRAGGASATGGGASAAAAGSGARTRTTARRPVQRAGDATAADDFSEIEDILRRRGIT